jgi:hypothetical protein
LYWRWLPRVRFRIHPSSLSNRMTSRTFNSRLLRSTVPRSLHPQVTKSTRSTRMPANRFGVSGAARPYVYEASTALPRLLLQPEPSAIGAVLSEVSEANGAGNLFVSGCGRLHAYPRSFQYPGRRRRCMTACTQTTSPSSR